MGVRRTGKGKELGEWAGTKGRAGLPMGNESGLARVLYGLLSVCNRAGSYLRVADERHGSARQVIAVVPAGGAGRVHCLRCRTSAHLLTCYTAIAQAIATPRQGTHRQDGRRPSNGPCLV